MLWGTQNLYSLSLSDSFDSFFLSFAQSGRLVTLTQSESLMQHHMLVIM